MLLLLHGVAVKTCCGKPCHMLHITVFLFLYWCRSNMSDVLFNMLEYLIPVYRPLWSMHECRLANISCLYFGVNGHIWTAALALKYSRDDLKQPWRSLFILCFQSGFLYFVLVAILLKAGASYTCWLLLQERQRHARGLLLHRVRHWSGGGAGFKADQRDNHTAHQPC